MSKPGTSVARDEMPLAPPPPAVAFGEFSFDFDSAELFCEGRAVALRPLPTRALALLLEREGGLVSREEFRRALWGERFVDWEAGLHQCIRQIRRALESSPGSPTYIETVPRRGYRLAVPVRLESAVTAASGGPSTFSWTQLRAFAAGAATAVAIPLLFVAICALLAQA